MIIFLKQIKVNNSQKRLNEKVDKIDNSLTGMKDRELIKYELSQVIQQRAIEGIRNNSLISSKHKDIIINWSEKIEKFSHDVFFSKYRGKEGINDYLDARFSALNSDIESYISNILPGKIEIGESDKDKLIISSHPCCWELPLSINEDALSKDPIAATVGVVDPSDDDEE